MFFFFTECVFIWNRNRNLPISFRWHQTKKMVLGWECLDSYNSASKYQSCTYEKEVMKKFIENVVWPTRSTSCWENITGIESETIRFSTLFFTCNSWVTFLLTWHLFCNSFGNSFLRQLFCDSFRKQLFCNSFFLTIVVVVVVVSPSRQRYTK